MYSSAQWVQLDDQRRKFVHQWGKPEDADRTIFLIHGLGEHGLRYQRLARHFVDAGWLVLAFDQQGHGMSPEDRGCIESYESLLDDIAAFLSWGRELGPERMALFGHSMGGNLVLNYASRRKDSRLSAVISSSPMVRATRRLGWLQEQLARVVLMLMPNYQLESDLNAERLMSDPEEQEELLSDELFHSSLSLRLGGALIDSGRWLLENAAELETPTLVTHGSDDYMTCPDASREFALSAEDICQFILLEGYLHEPFRDLGKQEVIDQFLQFLDDRTSG